MRDKDLWQVRASIFYTQGLAHRATPSDRESCCRLGAADTGHDKREPRTSDNALVDGRGDDGVAVLWERGDVVWHYGRWQDGLILDWTCSLALAVGEW